MIKSMSAAPLRPTHGVGNSALEKASALEKGEKGYRAQKKADAKKKLLSARLTKINHDLKKIIADLRLGKDRLTITKLTKIDSDLKKIIDHL